MGVDPFLAHQQKHDAEKPPKCEFCKNVEALPKSKRQLLGRALVNPAITQDTIRAVLADWGIITSKTNVSRHRSGNVLPGCRERVETWKALNNAA